METVWMSPRRRAFHRRSCWPFSRMGGASSSMEGMLSQIVNELQNSPAPSMLKTVWGGVWSCLLFGVVFGLIIAGVIARAPKPFGKDSNE